MTYLTLTILVIFVIHLKIVSNNNCILVKPEQFLFLFLLSGPKNKTLIVKRDVGPVKKMLLQHKDNSLIHKSASVTAKSVFKLSSVRISIRMTTCSNNIDSKHVIIIIYGHTSSVFKAFPILLIFMQICCF